MVTQADHHHHHGVLTVTRRCLALLVLPWMAGCGNRGAEAPSLKRYQWPDAFAYYVEYVAEAQRDARPVARIAEVRTLRFEVREGGFLLGQDSVVKTWQQPGSALDYLPYVPEDTLAFTVALDGWGLMGSVIPGCDPIVVACAEALPSAIRLQLRHVVPKLPLWEAPVGGSWTDTLAYDDAARPRGTRGALITTYTVRPDTVIGGQSYWTISWRSERTSFRRGGLTAVALAEPPVRTEGVTYLDQQRFMPVYSIWAGVALAPADLRAIGATAIGFRGRAYLVGSGFQAEAPPVGR
jgi:hypothetical protein